MPKVYYVKKARKDNPVVKAGGSYYWWKFRYSNKHYSTTYPKASQLTQSAFLSTIYSIEENMPDTIIEDDVVEIIAQLEELRDECECSLDNMPDQLRDSSWSGELLQSRIDGLEKWISEIEGIDWDSIVPEEVAEIVTNANPGV